MTSTSPATSQEVLNNFMSNYVKITFAPVHAVFENTQRAHATISHPIFLNVSSNMTGRLD